MTRAVRTAGDRSETVALLALLRAAPSGTVWSDIACEVLDEGSAIAVLDATQDGLVADPACDEARAAAEAELCAWEADGLDLVTVLSERYPRRLA